MANRRQGRQGILLCVCVRVCHCVLLRHSDGEKEEERRGEGHGASTHEDIALVEARQPREGALRHGAAHRRRRDEKRRKEERASATERAREGRRREKEALLEGQQRRRGIAGQSQVRIAMKANASGRRRRRREGEGERETTTKISAKCFFLLRRAVRILTQRTVSLKTIETKRSASCPTMPQSNRRERQRKRRQKVFMTLRFFRSPRLDALPLLVPSLARPHYRLRLHTTEAAPLAIRRQHERRFKNERRKQSAALPSTRSISPPLSSFFPPFLLDSAAWRTCTSKSCSRASTKCPPLRSGCRPPSGGFSRTTPRSPRRPTAARRRCKDWRSPLLGPAARSADNEREKARREMEKERGREKRRERMRTTTSRQSLLDVQ